MALEDNLETRSWAVGETSDDFFESLLVMILGEETVAIRRHVEVLRAISATDFQGVRCFYITLQRHWGRCEAKCAHPYCDDREIP